MIAFLSLSSVVISAQERTVRTDSTTVKLDTIAPVVSDSLVMKTIDSLRLVQKSIDSLNVKINDTIAPPETLESIVEHSADSLIRQDMVNNRVYLYKNARVTYKDMELTAGYIEIDNNTNEIIAKGIKDSIGEYVQLPEFKQGATESIQDTIKFNIETEKAKSGT